MYLKVRVNTEQKQETFKKISKDTYEISVKEPREKNKANERVLELLKEKLEVKRIKLVSGHHRMHKIVEVE